MKTLKEFLTDLGDAEAAELIGGVTRRTVAAWRRGERRPRTAKAARIVEVAKSHPTGPVSYAGIYQPLPPAPSAAEDRPRPEFPVSAPDGSLIGYAETAHGVIALVRRHQRKSITPASAGKGGAA